jgi:hypothetical protein
MPIMSAASCQEAPPAACASAVLILGGNSSLTIKTTLSGKPFSLF